MLSHRSLTKIEREGVPIEYIPVHAATTQDGRNKSELGEREGEGERERDREREIRPRTNHSKREKLSPEILRVEMLFLEGLKCDSSVDRCNFTCFTTGKKLKKGGPGLDFSRKERERVEK